jgi:acetylornithine deacetylase/succinyl-diaminopimelate desuccinylase-like protein
MMSDDDQEFPLPRRIERRMTRRAFARAGGAGLAIAMSPLGRNAGAAPQNAGPESIALAERYREDLTALLSALVAIRSHTGEPAAEAQQVVVEFLERLPYRIEVSEDVPSRLADHPEFMPPNPPGDGPFVNVVGHPAGDRVAPVGIFAHVDTEVPGDGWRTDPYRMTEVEGRLHGLGTADDKGGVAAMLAAAAAMHESGGALPTVMSLHGKGGGSRGSLPVFERFAGQGVDFEAVLYAHPAETGKGLLDIKHEVKGALDLSLSVSGWRGRPLEIGGPDSAPFHEGGDALRACWSAIEHLRDTVLADHEVNVGVLESGDRVGAVPASARARIRILFRGAVTWRQLFAALRDELDAYIAGLPAGGDDYTASLRQDGLATNFGTVDWDSPASRQLRDAITRIKGTPPRPYTNHYAGDIRFPIRILGAQAFGIGSLAGDFYGPNEWVDEDDLVRLTAVIVETVRSWSARGATSASSS